MPIFDYVCGECGTTYDIYHKVREVAEDILCPSCGSTRYKKLISAPAVSIGGKSTSPSSSSCSTDFGGCCGGGSCGI
ncbi:MAG: zinc ribbon domain-containing protein [Ignavibacteria bacterium]|nr:zinc ribbon domain-containing protein [Ignavibacteria bacterium]